MFSRKLPLYAALLTMALTSVCAPRSCVFNDVLCVWGQIWPSLLCDWDFIKGVCFLRMAETQERLKRKAHNLPIIHIMCQNIEEWFTWQSPSMTFRCFMVSECNDKYHLLWAQHKITHELVAKCCWMEDLVVYLSILSSPVTFQKYPARHLS